jgi:SAM-dependent methyltransferase
VGGLDPDAGMLTVAARLSPTIEFRQGVAESLPYPEQSFDAVVSQLGLMFFRDRTRALGEMQRVLRPGGRITVAVWDALENTPAYAAIVDLLERIAGSRAADALRAPFALGDRSELARVFANAGVADATITTCTGASRFPSIRRMVEADLRGWLPVMGVVLTDEQIARILEEAEHVLRDYRTASGEVRFDSPAHIVAAVRR